MRLASVIGATLGTGLATGAAMTAYALWEARQYTLRHVGLPVLPEGADPLRVLHLSDMHVVPSQHKKLDWIASLASLKPDLVVDTGDNLAHQRAVPSIVNALGTLLDVPGVFVHGSNDYYEPRMRNPIGYLLPDNGKRQTNVPELPWRDLSASFTKSGWLDLTNTRSSLTVKGIEFAFAGVDDPHLRLDDLSSVAGPADPSADVRLGRACSVSTGPGPVHRRRLRRDPGRPHPRRSDLPAGRASPGHQPRSRPRPGPRPAHSHPRRDGRRGCTSRPASAPRPTPGSASPAAPRRRS